MGKEKAIGFAGAPQTVALMTSKWLALLATGWTRRPFLP
jgi:hypothetical protein